jgi:hypothetical protein
VPRLTSRVFADLAIWMMGFGLLIGLLFPPFCLWLGCLTRRSWRPLLYLLVVAGLVVRAVNFGLSRLVVARLRLLADRMGTSGNWPRRSSATIGVAVIRRGARCRSTRLTRSGQAPAPSTV